MSLHSHTLRLLALAVTVTSLAGPALAEKPEWAGGGKDKHEKHQQDKGHKQGKHDDGGKQGKAGGRQEVRVGHYFSDQQRHAARTVYVQEYGGGSARKCPPGLAKKNNGCMPPGQAKKYQVGRPLPADVVYYPVPQPVLVQLPAAPAGHKYVRVAADILLIAVGSSMVIDAISDLGRL